MAQALEEARERETIEAMEKAERSELAQYLGPKLELWAKGKSDNLRALLSTLQDVLWEDCNWKEVSMMDLMNPSQVKKQYRKAMIIMHPDKVKQRGGTTEQIYIADYSLHPRMAQVRSLSTHSNSTYVYRILLRLIRLVKLPRSLTHPHKT